MDLENRFMIVNNAHHFYFYFFAFSSLFHKKEGRIWQYCEYFPAFHALFMKRYMDFGQILLKKGKDFSISSIINKTNKKGTKSMVFPAKSAYLDMKKKILCHVKPFSSNQILEKSKDLVDMGKKNNEQCLPYPNPFLNTQTTQSQHSL